MYSNEIHDAFPAYDFTDYIEKMKTANADYIEKCISVRKAIRKDEGDPMIDAGAAKERVRIRNWFTQNEELIPKLSSEHRKRYDKENEESVRVRNKKITDGNNADRDLSLVKKAIETIERQLVRMTPVINNGSIYLRRWFPWAILLLVASVDSYVLFNQFVDMRLSIIDSVISTIGVLLAVDLLVPLALIVFIRARLERTKAWVLTPIFIVLATLIVTITFASVSEKNETARNALATQIQLAEENGDIDGTLASLSKAYAELPTNRQILAKGLIPVVTTCVSLAVFALNTPGSLYLEKQETLKKHRSREKELEIITKAGQEAEREMASQIVFDPEADEAKLRAEKEALYQHSLDELNEITIELKEHFRLTLNTTPVSATTSVV